METQAVCLPLPAMGDGPTTYEAFMASIEKSDPQAYARATEAYPVLTDRQMRSRAKREIAISQLKTRNARLALRDLFYSSDDEHSGTD